MHSDAEIVQRVLNGNVDAFELLMKKHQTYILNIIRKHVPYGDVEETTQEAFIRAYRSLKTFKGNSQFKYWLSAIAVRTCSDYWRKVYRSKEISESALTESHRRWLENTVSDQSEHATDRAESRQEAKEVLSWALGRLSPQDRMVLELVYLEGLSGKEAAELLGCSVANVKVRSYRSRRKLRRIIEEGMQE